MIFRIYLQYKAQKYERFFFFLSIMNYCSINLSSRVFLFFYKIVITQFSSIKRTFEIDMLMLASRLSLKAV